MSATLGRSTSPTTPLLAGLVLVGLALRLPSFGDSLFADELSTNYVVHGFGVGSVLEIVGSEQENTPPLFYLLTWLTKGLGDVEGLRMVSLLAGLAAIPLTYLLGLRTVGRPAAIVGAALVVLSPFLIFYSTEARAYALVMLLCLVAALCLLAALDSGRTRWWVGYGLSVAAVAYTHYAAVFVVIGLFGWAFFVRPEARRPLLLATLAAALLVAPWFPEFLEDARSPSSRDLEVLHPLTSASARTDLGQWSHGHPLIPVHELPGLVGVWLIAISLVLGVAGVLARRNSGWDGGARPTRSGVGLVLILAVSAPVGALVWSMIGTTLFAPRNLIASWPGLALSAGALVTGGREPWRAAAVGLLLGGFALGAVQMLDADNRRPDYAGVARYIERSGGSDPVVDGSPATPGPQTPLEAALAPRGEAVPPQRTVLAFGRPTLSTLLAARREGASVLYALLPVPADRKVARQAVQASSGTLFVVTAGTGAASLEELAASRPEVADFLAALPPGYREVSSRTFPALLLEAPTVHVLSAGAERSGRRPMPAH